MKDYRIKIEIKNIHVGKIYYSFDYSVYLDNKIIESKNYSGDHNWGNTKEQMQEFREHLENNGAANKVIANLEIG